ncbi:MAG: RsmE family RNA methyltransferase [Planctomycetota bacterium]|nr:RsmE family RNA methyltransferase [Planctomycetota bacterium]MEC8354358.1 RsmE family RNA methyltransferase [Planctomycetota bacterium]
MIRLYADQRFEVGAVVALPPEEMRYLRTVRRGGHEAQLFNRAGQVAEVTIEDNLARIERVDHNPWPLHPLRVAVGLPEPSVVKQLIASLSELGVTELSFFKADRSQASLSRLPSEDKQDRLAVEAARQCERPIPLRVTAVEFESLVDASSAASTVVLDEQPDAGSSPVGSEVNLLVVGPEGGWSARERDAFIQASVPRMHLPTPILRVATAAVAATSWCLAHRSLP